MTLDFNRIEVLSVATIILITSGILMVVIAYGATGLFSTDWNERLELTKLMLTGILGTGTLLAILEKMK